MTKTGFLLVCLLWGHRVWADIYPDGLKDLGHLADQASAVSLLFEQNYESIQELPKGEGKEHAASFKVVSDNRKWFVKTVRRLGMLEGSSKSFWYYLWRLSNKRSGSDSSSSSNGVMNLAHEWELVKRRSEFDYLSSVNAELVLPERAAFFSAGDEDYYIVSYPMVPGKSMRAMISKTDYASDSEAKKIWFRLAYRFAQAMAALDFGPASNAEPMDLYKRLAKPSYLHLDDRNSTNQLYDKDNDRIYFIDLASEEYGFLKLFDSVSSNQEEMIETLLEILEQPACMNNACFDTLEATIIDGYTSAVPRYGSDELGKVVKSVFRKFVREECDEEDYPPQYCQFAK